MESNNKPVCRYGTKCYRKNANHLNEYFHHSERRGNKWEMKKKTGAVVKTTINDYDKNNREKNQSPDDKCYSRLDPKMPSKKREWDLLSEEEGTGSEMNKNKTSTVDNVKVKKMKKNKQAKTSSSEDSESDSNDVKSNSWTYIKTQSEDTSSSTEGPLSEAKKEETIKFFYLVDMPPDFYSFFKFCESINQNEPLTVLNQFGLNLVGPFDILAGTKVNVSEREIMLCHWRYFFDPPEFQTIVASDCGYHIGYWRDSPKQHPVFVASNNSNKDCQFKIEGENIFGAVHNYLTEFIKTCDPFEKATAAKLQAKLKKWAEKENYLLDKLTPNIKYRQKKVNSKTFHGAGIVVPVQKKTDVGYRPLCETDANLKKMFKLIIDAEDKSESEALMEKLQPLITFANIANDECDFGNSLELGINLFCMGSSVFDSTVEHLLTTAYSLLNRAEFGKIITQHLKNRRKDKNLSVL